METTVLKNYCNVCNKPSLKTCGACNNAFYCSSEHQKVHWKQHKSKCFAFIIKKDGEIDLGRYAVAARVLKAGSVVLQEVPFTYAPNPNPENDGSPSPTCLTCCKVMKKDDFRKCSSCGWPTCSSACEKVSHHADLECKLFADKKVIYSAELSNSSWTYSGILVLRSCLLKAANDRVLLLQNKRQIPIQKTKNKVDENEMDAFRVTDLFSVEEWASMKDIIALNAKYQETIVKDDSETFNIRGAYLFIDGSFFNHSCSPNCTWEITPGVQTTLRIRTTVNVKKGEMLTICYNHVSYEMGTMERQKLLEEFEGFVCKCERCLDNTELNSEMSTLICENCMKPTLRSNNPLNKDSTWNCSSCDFTKSSTQICELLNSLAISQDLSGDLLHPHHWIITRAENKIFHSLESKVNYNTKYESNDEERTRYLNATEHLLRIVKFVSPGLSRDLALLKAGISREKTLQAENDFIGGRIVHSQFKEEIDKAAELLRDAYNFFNVDCSPEKGTRNSLVCGLEEQLDKMKTLELLASNEFIPVKMSSNKSKSPNCRQ